MSYTINEKTRAVVFRCTHCGAEVRRPLYEAGTRQPCPACMSTLTVPGEQEARAILQSEHRETEDRRRMEEWLRSMPAAAPPPAVAAAHERPHRLPHAALTREHEALAHAFPGPAPDESGRALEVRTGSARRGRFDLTRFLLLAILGLIVWYAYVAN